MKLSSPGKILFEDAKITKQGVADYYKAVAKVMLPFIKGRAISLVRCPDGVEAGCHYRKNKDGTVDEVITISNLRELLNEVRMNTIEFHMYGYKINNPDSPDIMVFDLDPGEGTGFAKIRQGARDVRGILQELGLACFLKTSGGAGFHIVVPFSRVSSYQVFSDFAHKIALLMEAKWPTRYTTNIRKDARKGKIFVDWLRNSRGATSVAPYSLRARTGAAISFPLSWEELDKYKPADITINNVREFLKKKNPWEDFFKLGKRQRL